MNKKSRGVAKALRGKITKSADVLLLGAGPANIFAAIELVNRASGMRIAIIDRGPSSFKRVCRSLHAKECQRCPTCAVVEGFGGAGMYSDGKLHRSDGMFADRVYSYLQRFGLKKFDRESNYHQALSRTETLLKHTNLRLFPYVSQHIGTEQIISITNKMESFLVRNNVELILNSEVVSVEKKEGGFIVNCNHLSQTERQTIFASRLSVGLGKTSFSKMRNILGKLMPRTTGQYAPAIGVRFEFPNRALQHITDDIIKDPQLIFKSSAGDIVRTFCTCSNGHVVPYMSNGNLVLGGHSHISAISGVSNFAILFQSNGLTAAEVDNYLLKCKRTSPGRPIIQTVANFISHNASKPNSAANSTLKNPYYADISQAMPARTKAAILEFIAELAKIHPAFLDPSNALSAPVVEFCNPHLALEDYTKSGTENLFITGDSTGFASGILSSAITGLMTADFMLDDSAP